MNYAEESLRLHQEWQGKIEVVSRVPVTNREELSLAFDPRVGVGPAVAAAVAQAARDSGVARL